MSCDPAFSSYLPSDNKKKDSNLPGQGGIFNTINLNLYHYTGNNPIIYIDPDGRSLKDNWNKYKSFFNPQEKKELIKKGISPFIVAQIAFKALNKAAKEGNNQGWNGEDWQGRTDAFRHAYWNAKLTKVFGEKNAEFITTLHEVYGNNSPDEIIMDMNNNELGRNIVSNKPFISDKELTQTLISNINNNKDMIYFKDFYNKQNASQTNIPIDPATRAKYKNIINNSRQNRGMTNLLP